MKIILLLILLPFIAVGQKRAIQGSKSQSIKATNRLPASINAIKESIVQIWDHSKAIPEPIGSGFFVTNEGHLITNLHVVAGQYNGPKTKIMVGLPTPNNERFLGNFNGVDGEIIDIDPIHDLALIKLDINPYKNLHFGVADINGNRIGYQYGKPKFSTNPIVDGISIAVSGFPLSQPVLITNSGIIASTFGRHTFKGVKSSDRDAYYADMQINHGNSGGPVYLAETGEIIGVAVAFLYAQPEESILQSNGIAINRVKYIQKATKNDTIRAIADFLLELQTYSVYNSGLSIIIPLKYVEQMLLKNKIRIR